MIFSENDSSPQKWICHCINIVTRKFINYNTYTDNHNSLKPQINIWPLYGNKFSLLEVQDIFLCSNHLFGAMHHLYYIYIWMHEGFKEHACMYDVLIYSTTYYNSSLCWVPLMSIIIHNLTSWLW